MTKRLIYIDTTRAILITLVVIGHVLNYANPQYNIIPYTLAQEFINAFHMPAFFLLSGLLTGGEKWRSRPAGAYFVHKAKTLLIPYLFFECLAILYKHFALHSVSLAEGLRLMLTALQCRRRLVFACNVSGVCTVLSVHSLPTQDLVGRGRCSAAGASIFDVHMGGTLASTIIPRRFGLCIHADRESSEKAADGIQMVENYLCLPADGGHIGDLP